MEIIFFKALRPFTENKPEFIIWGVLLSFEYVVIAFIFQQCLLTQCMQESVFNAQDPRERVRGK